MSGLTAFAGGSLHWFNPGGISLTRDSCEGETGKDSQFALIRASVTWLGSSAGQSIPLRSLEIIEYARR